jgi:hypothetical protein
MDDEQIRLYLQDQLETAFPELTVYYRPPGNLLLDRPCVIYEPKALEPSYSGNVTYVVGTRFQITILSDLPGYADKRKVLNLPNVTVFGNSSYVTSDIVHDIFTVLVNTIT